MQIVAFYTDDEVYGFHVELFQKSLSLVGWSAHIRKIKKVEWLQATAYKPSFLCEMRDAYSGPILYLDIDAYIHDIDEYFFNNIEHDIAIHYTQNGSNFELLSGTIYLADNQVVHDLLQEWRSRVYFPENRGKYDQLVLQEILDEWIEFEKIKVDLLPAEYCYIFDKFKSKYPKLQPKIEHLQASREIKFMEKNNTFLRRLLGLRARPSNSLLRRRRRLGELAAAVGMELPGSISSSAGRFPKAGHWQSG